MFALVPDIPVSEKTLASHRMAWLRWLSGDFPGMSFTYDGTWHGQRGDHTHDAPGAGLLRVEICDCPECLMVEFPGWTIRGNRHDGYDAGCGGTVAHFGCRSALVCRLSATTTWGAQ